MARGWEVRVMASRDFKARNKQKDHVPRDYMCLPRTNSLAGTCINKCSTTFSRSAAVANRSACGITCISTTATTLRCVAPLDSCAYLTIATVLEPASCRSPLSLSLSVYLAMLLDRLLITSHLCSVGSSSSVTPQWISTLGRPPNLRDPMRH